ncbi:MAG TPA: alpha/beta hydrolase [Acidimicrobiales bacterium]|nr:alpha/beta hydrolase [Acidimicrobiales bacterium]
MGWWPRHARLACDQRGHGRSEPGPVGVSEFVQDLTDVVEVLGLDRPILYGGSFGTLVALAYLAAGGAARVFITEDGRLSDVLEGLPDEDPPARPRRVLSDDAWSTYLEGFSAAGPTGGAHCST